MLQAGEVVEGRYRVLRVLGRGGTGTVYLVIHEALGMERALKEISRADCPYYPSMRQRMIREIHILRQLDHPNLPEIMDIVMKEDAFYIVMEYIQGRTLREIIEARGRIEERQAVEWGRQICDVLYYLHAQNPPVIYRDLKPSNLMQKPDGRIVLIDFGTAREYAADREDTVCLGTRGYAAPEQYERKARTDARTDIYCLGATLYHLVTGDAPGMAVCEDGFVRRRNPDLSPGMEELIRTCMQPDPAKRYQNCREVRYVLDHLDTNTRKYRRGERRNLLLFSILLTGTVACYGAAGLCGGRAKSILTDGALIYVRQAEQAAGRDTAGEDYIKALELMPSERRIYESMQQMYIRVNDFREEDAAVLTGILETARQQGTGVPVLEVLRKEDPSAYCTFCYGLGIGYFYYMKGTSGKREAQVWFRNVCETADKMGNADGFSTDRRRRASLYGKISEYYNTFLASGMDGSGEENAGYAEFFRTLQELNRIKVRRDSSPSHMAAASMVSMEVAVELGNYAVQFQREGGISAEEIQKELDQIATVDEEGETGGRLEILRIHREEEEIENLKQLVLDAGDRNRLAEQELRWLTEARRS